MSVPWFAVLAASPFIAAILTSNAFGSAAVAYLIIPAGIAAMAYIHHRFVPLAKR